MSVMHERVPLLSKSIHVTTSAFNLNPTPITHSHILYYFYGCRCDVFARIQYLAGGSLE